MRFRLMARMVVPTTILASGLLLVGGLAAWYLHRLQREASWLLVASVAKVRAAEELDSLAIVARPIGTSFCYPAIVNRLPLSRPTARGGRLDQTAKGLANSPQEVKLIAEIEHGYGRFVAKHQEVNHDPPRQSTRVDRPLGSARDQEKSCVRRRVQ